LSAESLGWHDEQDQEERRRVRKAMYVSLGVHVVVFAALVISPPATFAPMPQSISVELIAGPEASAPAQPRPAARKKASPPPAPEPAVEEAAPEPPPEPPPPMPKAPVQVLPENAPKPEKKVEQVPEEKKPKEVAKAEPKPKPAKPATKATEKSLSLDDAMKSLEEELGEDETTDLLAPPPSRPSNRPVAESGGGGAAESRAGTSLNPEDAAWGLATRRKIQGNLVTPSNFRGRGLVTVMALEITSTGELKGEPEVFRTSGDPYFDDFAVLAVVKSNPLPPPPRPGRLILIFPSEEN
jgi:outer membrane biosynthesis protein TonB